MSAIVAVHGDWAFQYLRLGARRNTRGASARVDVEGDWSVWGLRVRQPENGRPRAEIARGGPSVASVTRVVDLSDSGFCEKMRND